MIKQLVQLATTLDSQGKYVKADRLDSFIMRWAQQDWDREPTPEELMAEEAWLEEEGIDPYSLTEEDALEGLEGNDMEIAKQYMRGGDLDEIEEMLRTLTEQQEREIDTEFDQSRLLQQLSEMLAQDRIDISEAPESSLLMPFQREQMVGEASLAQDLVKLSNILDARGMHTEADFFDGMLQRLAMGPGDDDWDNDWNFPGMDQWDIPEPSTEELMEMESEEEDDYVFQLLGFVNKVAKGMFMSLQAAQLEAKQLMDRHDSDLGVYKDVEKPAPYTPPNVIRFPGSEE